MESIYNLPKLYKALVLARPSKVCKSPYLADVKVFDEDGNVIEENVMAHSPALGCCGLISKDAYVMCAKSESLKAKSKYVIHHVVQDSIIGVNPMLANPIVKSLLLQNKIKEFQNIKELKAEITVDESRFDFTFLNEEGKRVYLEVKNVPLADVVDVSEKERKKLDLEHNMHLYDFTKKIAIFPDGYRKNKAEPVSPRALKHVNHLAKLRRENPDVLCALVFLIQRTDVVSFKPSSLDPIYHKAVYDAIEDGVLVLPLCVSWEDNECKFLKPVELLGKDYKSI
jgi:DNA-binding sugar fermentation-stimulating protein